MPTIHDVAQLAGVAPSTVSLVANGKSSVTPETRQRVQAAIRQLGYRGRAGRRARTPRANASPTPAKYGPTAHILTIYTREALCNGEMVQLCREVVHGIRQIMQPHDARMSLFAGTDHVDADPMFWDCLEARDFDGILLVSPQPTEGYLEAALKTDVPVVTVNRPPAYSEFSSVCVDYYGAGRQAAHHLAELGHRRLAILTDEDRWISRAYHAGFTAELAARDIGPPLVLRPSRQVPNPEEAARLAGQLAETEATAVFTGDRWAVLLADALSGIGRQVPQDVSMLGLDDLGLRTSAGRRLGSIGFAKRAMGRMAARLMLRRLRGRARVRHTCLSVSTALRAGQTVVAPAHPESVPSPSEGPVSPKGNAPPFGNEHLSASEYRTVT